jgi:membrane protein
VHGANVTEMKSLRWIGLNSKRLLHLLNVSLSRWNQHRAPKLGAALAYYTVLSLAPLLVLTVAIAGYFFGAAAVRGDLAYQLQSLMGPESAQAIQTVLKTTYKPGTGIISTVLGVATLLFGASGAFTELQDSLNLIWDAPRRAGSGIINEIRSRFFSFAMVLAIGFLLLVSLSLSAGLAAAGKFVGGLLPVSAVILETFNFLFSLVAITFLFALIYKYVPDVRVEWSDVWIGAAMTSLLFSLGKFIIGFYLGKAAVGSAYGAAGSLVVVLVWVYFSAQIFWYGAEFTQVYATSHGSQRAGDFQGAIARPEMQQRDLALRS